ncbi:MAG TPA: hypothetical protein VGM08_03130 [Candidatus Saccharimonadales bacterium]|jgi:hypothetical protein
MWSYQTGAVNADGVMRMPGRLFDLVVFVMFGNLAFEYFFIVTSLLITFLSFYYFAYKFLNIQSVPIRLFGSLLFTFNPIFLGNLSKIGLILAAAMLPLCLVAVREVFEQKRFRYLFPWFICLNISLIHPFTFAVNCAVSGSYLLYQAWLHRGFAFKNWYKFVLAGVVFLLLNAYILLPLASMHTISKNVLSDTISSTPTDYTALVGVLNTGDIFTGLSLSKNVVLDYDFYNTNYAAIYFLGAFGFYTLLIGLYLRVEKRISLPDKRRVALLFGSLLVLLILATVTFLHVDTLIKLLINTPGGWAFRSPLKWQLYIPLALFGLLVLSMKYITTKKRRIIVYACLALTFVCMNSYLLTQIYQKLLVPRKVTTFSALQRMNLDHRSVLIINADGCWEYEQDHPHVMNELNQVLSSQDTQVKQVSASSVDLVDLGSFDYILGCQGDARSLVANQYSFKLTGTFANNTFQLYTDRAAPGYVSASDEVYGLTEVDDLGGKYDFAAQQLGEGFNYAADPVAPGLPATHLQQAFDGVSADNIQHNSMVTVLQTAHAGPQKLYVHNNQQPLFYSADASGVSITTTKQRGYQLVPAGNGSMPVTVPSDKQLKISYDDPAYTYTNLITNPSLESGLWQKKVGDCYNYDDQPQIGMSLDKTSKTAGGQSLELWSTNHIACTGPNTVPVTPGQHYLLSFDYQGMDSTAGYSVAFDDAQQTTLGGRLHAADSSWHAFTQVITVPSGAHTLRLHVEAYPDSSAESRGTAHFDNFKLIAVPDVQDHFYLVDQMTANLQTPGQVSYKSVNPAETTVHVSSARAPFYLQVGETYNAQWDLAAGSGKKIYPIPAADHLKLNGAVNGWYIDPAAICGKVSGTCTPNPAGGYDLDFVVSFAPQHWLYVGEIVSAATAVIGAVYYVYNLRHDRKRGVRYRLWR